MGILFILLSSQVQAAPQDEGQWSAEFEVPITLNRTILNPQGRVVRFSTTDISIWNPELGTGADAHITFTPDNPLGSLAFGNKGLLPNTGNVLIVGPGTTNDAAIFNTQTNRRDNIANVDMNEGGPEFSTLANGNIFVNDAPQQRIYSPGTNTWRILTGASNLSLRDQQWLAPSGKIFAAGFTPENFYYIDVGGNGGFTAFPGGSELDGGSDSVMYQPGKLYYPGGSSSINSQPFQIDITGSAPVLSTIPGSRDYEVGNARSIDDTIMLPNGQVLNTFRALGPVGNSIPETLEIWNPSTVSWSLMTLPFLEPGVTETDIGNLRLLKDGRVLTDVVNNSTSDNPSFLMGRIFSPPYLFNDAGQLAQRPTITNAPAKGTNGNQVAISHGAGNVISRVTLVKIDEQRFHELVFTDTANGVSATLPNSPNVTPPGFYLMYLIDNKGVPSEGHIINISAANSVTPAFPMASPDLATVTGGGQITINALANDTGTDLTLNPPNPWSQKGGNVALVGNKITYKPKAGFNGTDKIWYTFVDALGRSNSGEITITVSGNGSTSQPFPTATADNVTATTGLAKTIDVLANDKGDGLVLNAPNVWSLAGGRVALVNNKLVYTSKTGFTGSDKIWYVFKDSQGRTNSGQVNITVNATASGAFPVAKADYFTTTKGKGLVLDILANDTASGGIAIDTLYSYTAKGGWTNKTTDGKVWYKPKAGFTGEDNFWYVMIDSQGRKNSAQVKINVK